MAAGIALPEELSLEWRNADAGWPVWEMQPLALLRISATNSADERVLAALEAALETHVRARVRHAHSLNRQCTDAPRHCRLRQAR